MMPYAAALDAAETWADRMAAYLDVLEADEKFGKDEDPAAAKAELMLAVVQAVVAICIELSMERELSGEKKKVGGWSLFSDRESGNDDSGGTFSGGGFGGGSGRGW